MSDWSDLHLPLTVGKYRLEAPLGNGAMAKIYRGVDATSARPVAVKHLAADAPGHASSRKRFRREAKAVAKLRHPAIVEVVEWIETEAGDWLVMELIDGQSLEEMLVDGPIPPARVARLARGILEGLGAAHAIDIVHRDLKASNVMVTQGGDVKILDFGLVKRIGDGGSETRETGWSSGLTANEVRVGTVASMSPEQATGFPIDQRSDIFSLGTLLYELLTGISPFYDENTVQTLVNVCSQRQVPACEQDPRIPGVFSDFVDTLLEKDPESRPGNAAAAIQVLDSFAHRL